MFRSTRYPRIVAAAALVALLVVTLSDVLLTTFWTENAMLTSVVADVLVLIVGVVVVNEYVTARAADEWRLVAHYALLEVTHAAREAWVRLVDQLEIDGAEKVSVDELRQMMSAPPGAARLRARCEAVARDDLARMRLAPLVADLAAEGRDVLTGWASVMVGTPMSARAVSRFANFHGRLLRLSLVLNEEIAGHKLPGLYEVGDVAWIAERLRAVIVLAMAIDEELVDQAHALVPVESWRAAGATDV